MKIRMIDPESLPFVDNSDVRLWARNHGGRPYGWSHPGTDIPDIWVYHTDAFGNDWTVWISLLVARKFTHKISLTISPDQRHSMLSLSANQHNKVGTIIALRDTHKLYAVRLRSTMFGGDFPLDLFIAKGMATELERTKHGELKRAIEFISRDDGEVAGRWW